MVTKRTSTKTSRTVPARPDPAKPSKRQETGAESHDFYEHLFDHMLEGYAYCQIVLDHGAPTDFIYLDVNRAFEKLTGLKNVVGKKVSQIVPAVQASNPELVEKYARVARTGKPEKFDTYIEALGAWFSIRVYSPKRGFFVAVFENITERKKAEQALWESEEMYRTLVETADDIILLTDLDGKQLFRNNAYYTSLGFSAGETLELDGFLKVHPDDLPGLKGGMVELMLRGNMQAEYRVRHRDGRWLYHFARSNLIYDSAHQPQRVLTIIRDVTDRKQAEEAAELSEQRFRSLIENSAEAITLLDADGRVIYDSPAAPGMLGYGPDDWIGKNVFELLHPDDRLMIQKMFERLLESPSTHLGSTFRLRHKSGSWLWIEAAATNLLAEPSVNAIVVNYRDISERKHAEELAQRHSEHLAALHEIDVAIASSFNLKTSLDIFLEQVTAQLKVDAASVLLLDAYTNTLEYSAQRGFRRTNAIQTASIALGKSFAGRAALERKMVQAHGHAVVQESHRFEALWREEGFESYFVVPLIAKGHVKGVLEIFHRAPISATPDWLDFLSTLAGQAAIAIDNAQLFENLQHTNMELSLAYDATIEGWSYALDLRDKETEGHSLRVTRMTVRLAESMGLSKSEIIHIRRGALLHDIGKMGVPDHILLKPGALSSDEWASMKQHPVFAFNMLSRIAYLRPAVDIPYCHHEKWDGSGYPRGLKGEDIPLSARLFAIVDVWDALSSDRSYRAGWPRERVLEHIKAESGKHFDPQVVSGFLEMLASDSSLGSSA